MNFRLAERAYAGRIDRWVRRNLYKLPGLAYDHDDLVNEIRMVLWKAVQTYDPDKGAKFHSWFTQCLNNWYKDKLRRTEADCRRVNVHVEYLSNEGVAAAVENWRMEHSAEEEVLAPLTVNARLALQDRRAKDFRNAS